MRPSGGGVKARVWAGANISFGLVEGFRNRDMGHPPYEIALAAHESGDYKKALAALDPGVERKFRIAAGV